MPNSETLSALKIRRAILRSRRRAPDPPKLRKILQNLLKAMPLFLPKLPLIPDRLDEDGADECPPSSPADTIILEDSQDE